MLPIPEPTKKFRPFLWLALSIALLVSVGMVYKSIQPAANLTQPLASDTCPSFTQGTMQIGESTFQIGIVTTPETKAKGLSGCPHVPPQTGLLFPFSPASLVSFWMKDMLIPIDIIWIANGQVVGLEEDIPPPSPYTTDDHLKRYRPPRPVDAVLEIAAGQAQKKQLKIGDSVTIAPN